jgi:hypothetical protein
LEFAIQIESFSFGSVYDKLYFWDANPSPGQPTINKYNQSWVRGGGGDNAALYGIGTRPVFKSPVISISPSMPATTASVRILRGSGGPTWAQANDVTISGTSCTLPDITALFSESDVQYDKLTLVWEISFDGGSTWESIGYTDPLDFYWIPADPSLPQVFDYGIKWACQAIEAYRSTDYPTVLNSAISARINYLPNLSTPANYMNGSGWVLQVLAIPGGACLSNAYLLNYLLQSFGVNAGAVKVYWAGTSVSNWTRWNFNGTNPTPPCVNFHADAEYGCNSFNSNRNARDNVPKNPRFNFHAMVVIGSNTYDPSYGLTGAAATADFFNMWNGCAKQIGSWSDYNSTSDTDNCR